MPSNIKADFEVIISSALPGDPYVGISLLLPTILPVNLIERAPGVRPPVFVFRRVEGDIYTLSINGMQVIELERRLFAALERPAQEWVIKYRQFHDAYTITKRLDSREEIGWIAPVKGESKQIHIGPLGQIDTAPPGYPPRELFNFQFLDHEL
ncbi:hypothetical protein F5J12DRAFT_267388 [Pisolithus orientalis]|uniref:uncharacterized protein n=1 Tax=Pisolithus orientalis TaxID=936130 RepID=UPI0022250432|nr:uncharacterized protein F5J12DRAFT_267388 [Pisolithus orientalis]KAI5999786.1 hypothetical protein F5J12DRAFT_267388 [Pisolithus orientalis]